MLTSSFGASDLFGLKARQTAPDTKRPRTHSSEHDQPRACDEPSAHELGPPEQQCGEPDTPERLGCHERRDDRHTSTVVRLEEADVREAEAEAGGREDAELRPAGQAACVRDGERRADRERRRGCEGRRHRARVGEVPHEVVARREEQRADPGEDEARRAQVVRPPLGDQRHASAHDEERAEDERPRDRLSEDDEREQRHNHAIV